MYNVNDLGYYQGGVPRKNRGTVRGNSMGEPGTFHSPTIHNFIHYNHADSSRVTSLDTIQFKHYMGTDKADFNRTMPAYPMFYDKDFNYRKDRDFWLKILLGMAGLSYAIKKFSVETDRMRMTSRMEGYKEYANKPHHFINRGGVVIMKDFIGFEKYHKSGEDMMNWYK